MPLARRRITDPEALKVLAHPLRMALLSALVSEGPMTASQAASLLDESPSNWSGVPPRRAPTTVRAPGSRPTR